VPLGVSEVAQGFGWGFGEVSQGAFEEEVSFSHFGWGCAKEEDRCWGDEGGGIGGIGDYF